MKKCTLAVCAIVATIFLTAFVYGRFPGWQVQIRDSAEVAVVRCVNPDAKYLGGGLFGVGISVVDVLKGQTNVSSAILKTSVLMRQNEYYLVFLSSWDETSIAVDYDVVSIGTRYEKNMAAGGSLEERVRSLLRRRLGFLTRQIEEEQKEKQRLEQAFH